MKLKYKMSLVDRFRLANDKLKQKEYEEANDLFDLCLAHLSIATLKGIKKVEGTDIDIWKIRVWTKIEKAGFLPK
jgi:hypothetical protein